MVDLTLTVAEFREKIYEEELLQNFIRDILVIAGKEDSNRAVYTIVYHLIGKKAFPSKLEKKIKYCMDQGIIEKTFLRNNYEQRVYGMLSVKSKPTNEYFDFYYGDILVNLGKGDKANKNGRGLSQKRQDFLKKEICNCSIEKAIDEIVKQFSDKNLEEKYKDICNARKRILLLNEYFSVEDFVYDEEKEKDEQNIRKDTALSETEKKTLILARRGQGKFRKDVIERNKCCPFTGITNPKFLIASHIKPWKDSTNEQRLDANNGFALTPTYDRLFDQGYISFDDDKRLLVSSKLDKICVNALGLEEGKVIERLILSDSCKKYLEFHRKEKFQG